MQKLKVVRIDGKRFNLTEANLNQISALATSGIDFKNMTSEDMGEATPLMIEIIKDCLHSSRYEVSEGTAIEWITENLDLDELTDQAEANVTAARIEDNGTDADEGVDFDEEVEEELHRLVAPKMPPIVFLADVNFQILASLFTKVMPKKEVTKRLSKKKGA